jgi:hypothetical protein
VCPINKVKIDDAGSSGWYTIFGQAGSSKIPTAVIDTKAARMSITEKLQMEQKLLREGTPQKM